ncbi:MAG: flagellar biosynthesis protein FlgL, partial [Campylobacterota bacterium]|nr:flagellar biosynthesis protein FlgL [Campylobacterota bacterium]
RKITTNVEQVNKVALHPDLLATSVNPDEEGIAEYITETDTIRSLMGDTDNDATNDEKSYFYLRGTQHDGTSFKSKIEMSSDQKISDLLHEIGNAYGNTPANDLVTVSLNDRGQVVIEDRLRGSSKLDFHMVGAIDFSGTNSADVNDVSALHAGSTTFPNSGLYINEFVKSSMQTTDTASTISGIEYDKFAFKQSGSILTGSESQILKSDNAYAKDSTKLIDVASGQGDPQTLITQQLSVSGERVGGAAFDMQIDFNPAGATFSLDGGTTNYNIYDMSSPRVAVAADDMTYRQLMDVVNIAMSGELPATTNSPSDYDQAILDSQLKSNVNLNHLGQLSFEDKTATNTNAKLSIYDTDTDIYSPIRASIMTFNTNEALSIRDPKTDFFSQINDAISAVENYNMYSDGNSSDPENIGIQNALQIIDDMNVLVGSKQTKAGSQSQSLQAATDRSTMLLVNTQMLRSEVLDVDIADATLRLQQLSLSYQAMFSSISRISQLSLVNYL